MSASNVVADHGAFQVLRGAGRAESGGRGKASVRPVPGVSGGILGCVRGVLDATALARALPAERNTREGGFRDALESMALALLRQKVPLAAVNAAVEEVLDAYSNAGE